MITKVMPDTEVLDMAPFHKLIKEKCGLFFDETRAAKLKAGIYTRMSVRGIKSYGGYLLCVIHDQAEFNSLINLLTINETYFFREPAHLQLLTKSMLPQMLGDIKPGEKVRILSAGCSTGEEPYSLVMALMEKYGMGIFSSVEVMGADIDGEVIKKAEKGVYHPHSFRGVDPVMMGKYFESVGEKLYKIRNFVKDRVSFHRLNLLSDVYFDILQGVDVIFYRNVSIYFEPGTQQNIFRKLAGILKEHGYLFVSSTETFSHNIGVLSLIERDGVFLFCKSTEVLIDDRRKSHAIGKGDNLDLKAPGSLGFPAAYSYSPPVSLMNRITGGDELSGMEGRAEAPAPRVCPERSKNKIHRQFDEAMALARDKKNEDALRLVNMLIAREPSFLKAYSLKACVLLNMKRGEEAGQICLKGLEMDRWSLELHLSLGLIAKARGDEEKALKSFKEAIYIQPSCWPAHFYLADLYRERGELKKSCREYEITVKLLEKGDMQELGIAFFPLSFPVDQMLHLCRHNLSELKKELR